MKKLNEYLKDNKGELILIGSAILATMELVISGTILAEYDKGGNLETLKSKIFKRD